MVVPFIKARDVLYERLKTVFSSDVFVELYGCEKPSVTRGFPLNEPHFYVAVDEIVDEPQTDGAVSMGHAGLTFNINVYLYAQHSDLIVAANTLMSYIHAVFLSVIADQRLNGTVDNAFPRVTTSGTAADSSKRYIAAAGLSIQCQIFSQCPAQIKELINGLSGE